MRLVFWLLVAALSVWVGWEGIQNAMSTDKTHYGIAMAFLGLIGCTLSAVRLKRWREREQRWVEKNGGGKGPYRKSENHRPAKGKRNIKILKTKIRKAGLQLTETKDGFMVRVDMTKDEEGKKQLDDLATLKDLHMPEGWSGSIGWGSNACMVAEFRRTE